MKTSKRNEIITAMMLVCLALASINSIAQDKKSSRPISTTDLLKESEATYQKWEEWLNKDNKTNNYYSNYYNECMERLKRSNKTDNYYYNYYNEYLERLNRDNNTENHYNYNYNRNDYYNQNNSFNYNYSSPTPVYYDNNYESSYDGLSREQIQMDLNKAREMLLDLEQQKKDAEASYLKISYTQMISEQKEYIRQLEAELRKAKY